MQNNQGMQSGRYDLTGLKMIFFTIIGTYAADFILGLFSRSIVAGVLSLLVLIAVFVLWFKATKSLKPYSDHFGKILPNLIGAIALLAVGMVIMYVAMFHYQWGLAIGALIVFAMAGILLGYRAIQALLSGVASIPETAGDTDLHSKCLQTKKLWRILLIVGLVFVPAVGIIAYFMIVRMSAGNALLILLVIMALAVGAFGIVVTVLLLICTWQVYTRYDGMPIGVPAGAAQPVRTPGEPGKAGEMFGSLIHSASSGIHKATDALHAKGAGADAKSGGAGGASQTVGASSIVGAGAADQQRFCTMCGQPLGTDTRYCEYCGTKIEGRE